MQVADVRRIDGCARLHKFSAILAWWFVFNDSLFIRSLLSLILVRTVSNNIFIFVVHLA